MRGKKNMGMKKPLITIYGETKIIGTLDKMIDMANEPGLKEIYYYPISKGLKDFFKNIFRGSEKYKKKVHTDFIKIMHNDGEEVYEVLDPESQYFKYVFGEDSEVFKQLDEKIKENDILKTELSASKIKVKELGKGVSKQVADALSDSKQPQKIDSFRHRFYGSETPSPLLEIDKED